MAPDIEPQHTMPNHPVYMDHHATTPCDKRVVEAMLPFFAQDFGNPASVKHAFGRAASRAVLRARIQVAELVGASPKEVVFTSGATEAINLGLKGLAAMYPNRRHVVTLPTVHRAVLETIQHLTKMGIESTLVPVNGDGRFELEALAAAIRPDTLAVAVMAANNEVGTIHPIAAIGSLCQQRDVFFMCDATQAAGMIPLSTRTQHVHLCALSAHKMYGPKGVGALVVRARDPRVRLRPRAHGGSHENGLRGGTLNVPGIVGFGMACEIARTEMTTHAERLGRLRDQLLSQMSAGIPALRLNGLLSNRLPNNLNVSIPGIAGEELLDALDGVVAVSSGSACSTDAVEPSHVLRAMGVPDALAYASLRFGLGRSTTDEDVALVARSVVAAVNKLRR